MPRCAKPPKFFVFDTRIIKSSAMAEWSRNVWSIGTCFGIRDMFFPSSFPWKKVFYSHCRTCYPCLSPQMSFLCLFLTSKQAQLSLDWISVISLDRKRTCHCFKQLTAINGTKLHRKKKIQKFTYRLSLGPNENLLQAVAIEAKTVLLNNSLSHKFLTSLFSKSKEVQAELL